MSNFENIKTLYKKMRQSDGVDRVPHLIDDPTAMFRLMAMREELDELENGYREQDLPAIADALVDLVVFALGTAVLHDLPWEDLFTEVQRANMSKEARFSIAKVRNGVAGSIDLIKPEGWVSPDIKGLLKSRGWSDSQDSLE